MLCGRRSLLTFLLVVLALVLFFRTSSPDGYQRSLTRPFRAQPDGSSAAPGPGTGPVEPAVRKFNWKDIREHYPVSSLYKLPTKEGRGVPRLQPKDFGGTFATRAIQDYRRKAVLGNFTRAWEGYKRHAWLRDEAGPLSGKAFDFYGGWAATLVDSLDTLHIMGLKDEFDEAVRAVAAIDFSSSSLAEINIFETTIRYLGGLISAFELSTGHEKLLLGKITELGDMIYKAFDTPNRMPVTRWDFEAAALGQPQEAPEVMLVAELGSLTLEMTRLSQITGDNKYYDAIKRVMDELHSQQMLTNLPGLFPTVVNPRDLKFTAGDRFTLGGMVDSVYEYLPKQFLLLGGHSSGGTAAAQYREMYERAMKPVREHVLFRPMTPDKRDILLAGEVSVAGAAGTFALDPQAQHLTCFVGGMIALAAQAFRKQDDLELARKVVNGCVWAYDVNKRGIMPEIFHVVPCISNTMCEWNEAAWYESVDAMNSGKSIKGKIARHNLPPGISAVDDTRYGLRPEAIESLFVLYRLTGDPSLPDKAWEMFNSIVEATSTDIGAASLADCTSAANTRVDRMESFWFAETLKYFYLIFSPPDVISLDEWVFNTEAHPLRWAQPFESLTELNGP